MKSFTDFNVALEEGMYDIDPKTGESPVATAVNKANKMSGDKRLKSLSKLAKKLVGEEALEEKKGEKNCGCGQDPCITYGDHRHKDEKKVEEATLATARKNIGMDPKKPSCWKGYKASGTKMKGGKSVPDCKKEEIQVEHHQKDKDGNTIPHNDVVVEKKLDPVGKADADIDNDGDVDKSDKYLHARRKKIGKVIAMSKKK